jgi:hypothetical protein
MARRYGIAFLSHYSKYMHAIPSLLITAIKWQALLANNKSKMQAIIDNRAIIIITLI